MTWGAALHWIDAMNAANYLGYSDWRLPTIIDTGSSGCNFAYSGTDCGYNVQTVYSELAYMYHNNLGNQSYYTTTGVDSGTHDGGADPNSTLDNVGPFYNLQHIVYWSDLEYAPNTNDVWVFYISYGSHYHYYKNFEFYAWAVRPAMSPQRRCRRRTPTRSSPWA